MDKIGSLSLLSFSMYSPLGARTDSPKSDSLGVQSAETRTFLHAMSLCMILNRCRCSSPRNTPLTIFQNICQIKKCKEIKITPFGWWSHKNAQRFAYAVVIKLHMQFEASLKKNRSCPNTWRWCRNVSKGDDDDDDDDDDVEGKKRWQLWWWR